MKKENNKILSLKKNRMLSVCIPVYNYYVSEFVRSVQEQAISEQIEFEIIVFDDFSQEHYKAENRKITNLQGIVYKEFENNAGRSKIRNLLAQQAKYEFLLFMDCDARLTENFLKNYLQHLHKESVLVGGVSYSVQKPAKEYMLRWKYGIQRECTPAEERNKNPYHSFKTFNFLISKKLFQQVRFDENIKGYGHEDTLFGIELKKQNIPIIHIDNPLIHLGLETNEVFLNKTESGIRNLNTLMNSGSTPEEFMQNVTLLSFYNKIPSFIKYIMAFKFKYIAPLLKSILFSGRFTMRVFDFYKIGYLCMLRSNFK